MSQKTMIINAEEVFGNPRDTALILDGSDGSEISWTWPKEIGSGLMARIQLRPGLALGLGDFRIFEDVEIRFEQIFMPVAFSFCASWDKNYFVICKDRQDELCLAGSGCGSISYRPEWQGVFKYPYETPVRFLSVYMDTQLLNSFMAGQYDYFPTGLCDLAHGDKERSFEQVVATTPTVNMAIHKIFDCPYKGALKRFFLEAKALELVTYAMAQLIVNKDSHSNSISLHPNDIKRVRDIRDILLRNLEKTPTLLELARQSGINKDKLNRDFRHVFGVSLFEFLRASRLEHAKELLENNKINVTDAAFEVGYAHQQSFTRAFKNNFGTNPSDHLN